MTYNGIILEGPTLIQAHPTRIQVERQNSAMFIVLGEISESDYPQKVVLNVDIETLACIEEVIVTLRDHITSQLNPPPSVN